MSTEFCFDNCNFYYNGKPGYFSCGELHYYRIPKDQWQNRMRLLKESGAGCLATYIPWCVHEPEEGKFVLDQGDGITDLSDFLTLAASEGLKVIARPGPYTYSELTADGLPMYLVKKYPELLARNIDGNIFHEYSVSYLHPLFLEKTALLYDRLAPVLAKFDAACGGPVIMVQLDNETAGIHHWRGSLDYNASALGLGRSDGFYASFLLERYGSLAKINQAYGTDFAAANDIVPLRLSGVHKWRFEEDYSDFSCHYYAVFLNFLAGLLRKHHVKAPFCHNAGNIDLTACFRESKQLFGNELLLGCDHYWNLSPDWAQNHPTPQFLAKCELSLEMLKILDNPPVILEFQHGNVTSYPPISREDLEVALFYHLSSGMKGHNAYIFGGGPNPPDLGWSCQTYDYDAPVGADGQVRPTYFADCEYNQFISGHPEVIDFEKVPDFRILMPWELYRPGCADAPVPGKTCGRTELRDLLNGGIIRSAKALGLTYTLCDPDKDAWETEVSTVLAVVSGGVMKRKLQKRLVSFLKNGGRLWLNGVVPFLDENLDSCTILSDFCRTSSGEAYPYCQQCIKFGSPETAIINCSLFPAGRMPENAAVLGTLALDDSAVTAWHCPVGAGQLVVNGTTSTYLRQTYAEYMYKQLAALKVEKRFQIGNPWLMSSRMRENGHDWLFIFNAGASLQSTGEMSFSGKNLPQIELQAMGIAIIRDGEPVKLIRSQITN